MEKIKFNFADKEKALDGYVCPSGYTGSQKNMDINEESVEFFVLEQTRINGVNYILVTDSEEDDAEALILKDLSEDEAEDALYEILEEDEELEAVSKVFSEMLEDVDIIR